MWTCDGLKDEAYKKGEEKKMCFHMSTHVKTHFFFFSLLVRFILQTVLFSPSKGLSPIWSFLPRHIIAITASPRHDLIFGQNPSSMHECTPRNRQHIPKRKTNRPHQPPRKKHTFTHSHIHTFTHSHIHTFTHSHIHTFTHSHIHTFTPMFLWSLAHDAMTSLCTMR